MDTYQIVPLVDSAATEIDIQVAIAKLLAYCRANDWAGDDPYDALNSPIFRTLPFLDNRVSRLVFTQALKRSPVNVRDLLHIPKTQNPKAIALFLSALITLEKVNSACQQGDIDYMIDRLRDLRSAATDYWCWGYSFPWQTRTIVVPSGAPNLVCTTFVANALLDAWDHCRDPRCLHMAVSAAEYVLNRLYWNDGGAAGFSYPLPSLRGQIHNANFLAAALLCRVYKLTNDEIFLRPALRVVRYSTSKQRSDGLITFTPVTICVRCMLSLGTPRPPSSTRLFGVALNFTAVISSGRMAPSVTFTTADTPSTFTALHKASSPSSH
jgi:hypothetical protein